MKIDVEGALTGGKKEKLMSFEDIAEKLGVSKQSVFSTYKRAIAKLQKQYKIEYDNGKPSLVKIADLKETRGRKNKEKSNTKYISKRKIGNRWVYTYAKTK